MALTDPYATANQYRAAMGSGGTGSPAELEQDLEAISRWMERDPLGGRVFTKADSASARLYYGDGSGILTVQPISILTGLAVKVDTDRDGDFSDETALAATEYQARPINALVDGEPVTELHIPSWSGQGAWPDGSLIQVTAVWGWPAVPVAIVRACIHLTALLRMEGQRATNRINDMGEVLSSNREARGIVERLARAYGPGIVVG